MPELTKIERDQLALALILLKDFQSKGRFDSDVTLFVLRLAEKLGIVQDVDRLLILPVFKIKPGK